MARWMRYGALPLLIGVAVLATGCNDPEKTRLTQENQTLRNQLGQCQEANAALERDKLELTNELRNSRDANARIQEEASKKPQPAGGGGVAAGSAKGEWEQGLVGDRVTLGTDILFAAGKADLTTAGKGALDKIASDLKSTYGSLPVRVYGYTDTDPIRKTKNLWQDNLDLSANRAMAVTRYLVSKGIDAKLIETVAMGEHHPEGGKTQSRRVEIIVIKSKT